MDVSDYKKEGRFTNPDNGHDVNLYRDHDGSVFYIHRSRKVHVEGDPLNEWAKVEKPKPKDIDWRKVGGMDPDAR